MAAVGTGAGVLVGGICVTIEGSGVIAVDSQPATRSMTHKAVAINFVFIANSRDCYGHRGMILSASRSAASQVNSWLSLK